MTDITVKIKNSLKELINYLFISEKIIAEDLTQHYPHTLEENLSFNQIHTYIPIPFTEYLSNYPLFSHFIDNELSEHSNTLKKTQSSYSKKKYN